MIVYSKLHNNINKRSQYNEHDKGSSPEIGFSSDFVVTTSLGCCVVNGNGAEGGVTVGQKPGNTALETNLLSLMNEYGGTFIG